MKIAIISGGHRDLGQTQGVAHNLSTHLIGLGHSCFVADQETFELPLFQERINRLPDIAAKFGAQESLIRESDACLFISPEYNGGYSSTIKNYIDTLLPEVFAGKAIGVVAVSAGPSAGLRAALQLQQLVMALFAFACPQMLLIPTVQTKFDLSGKLIDASFDGQIKKFIDSFMWLAEAIAEKRSRSQNKV